MSRWKSDDKCCLVTCCTKCLLTGDKRSLTSKLADISWWLLNFNSVQNISISLNNTVLRSILIISWFVPKSVKVATFVHALFHLILCFHERVAFIWIKIAIWHLEISARDPLISGTYMITGNSSPVSYLSILIPY